MSTLAVTERYNRVAIGFHWLIAALIVVNLAIGLFGDSFPKDWKVMPFHKSVGITVLVLTAARLAWRLAHPAPRLPDHLKPWERAAGHASHVALYGLMFALPLTGWAMSSRPKPRPLMWFGLFDIPYLPVSESVSKLGHDAHGLLGWAMVGLLVLHVGAALRHHFILRDAVLARMTPGVNPPAA